MDYGAIRDQLIKNEGLKLKPYKDTVGKLTIGVGRNLDDKGISRIEALYLLENDITEVMRQLDANLPWWKTQSDTRKRALIDLCFNMGIGTLLTFKNTLAAWQRGDYDAAGRGLENSKWFTQVGYRGPLIVQMVKIG